jgi:hypothetical protein
MEETLEYWENIREQRLEDITCQEEIGNPDKELMNILLEALTEAESKIKEINGEVKKSKNIQK